jgi:hypothetical protein
MAYNSTIKQKKCKCGCDKYPTIGYNGYFIHHFPDGIKKQQKNNKASLSRLTRQVHKISKSKSDYLQLADMLFSKFIKKRDSDSQGNIQCVCCLQTYNVKDKDKEGNMIVNTMHFVSRGTYSLRFSEVNCHSGCCYCNADMHNDPEGIAYRRFRNYLVSCVGEDEVQQMELEKRNINKLAEGDLVAIIDKYKN